MRRTRRTRRTRSTCLCKHIMAAYLVHGVSISGFNGPGQTSDLNQMLKKQQLRGRAPNAIMHKSLCEARLSGRPNLFFGQSGLGGRPSAGVVEIGCLPVTFEIKDWAARGARLAETFVHKRIGSSPTQLLLFPASDSNRICGLVR